MKIENEDFFNAKSDPALNAFMLRRVEGRDYMELCLNIKLRYSDKTETVWVKADTKIVVDNYSPVLNNEDIKSICFHESVYQLSINGGHIKTFLRAIKKTSDVHFRVVAYNSCDMIKKVGFVRHDLHGIIDGNTYMLSQYVGLDNSSSPVNQR